MYQTFIILTQTKTKVDLTQFYSRIQCCLGLDLLRMEAELVSLHLLRETLTDTEAGGKWGIRTVVLLSALYAVWKTG